MVTLIFYLKVYDTIIKDQDTFCHYMHVCNNTHLGSLNIEV